MTLNQGIIRKRKIIKELEIMMPADKDNLRRLADEYFSALDR